MPQEIRYSDETYKYDVSINGECLYKLEGYEEQVRAIIAIAGTMVASAGILKEEKSKEEILYFAITTLISAFGTWQAKYEEVAVRELAAAKLEGEFAPESIFGDNIL